MRSNRTYLLLGLIIWGAGPGPAAAAAEKLVAPAAVQPLAPHLVDALTPAAHDSLQLARAAYRWRQGDLRGAVTYLETINLSGRPDFREAPRATFLLAVAYLELGEREKFLALTNRSDLTDDSSYRIWLDYARLLVTGTPPARDSKRLREFPGTVALTAVHLLAAGRNREAERVLNDRDAGEQFTQMQEYLRAVADADTTAAREVLAGRPAGPRAKTPNRRDLLSLGQTAAEKSDWTTANRNFELAAEDWQHESAWLDSLANERDDTAVWRLWRNELPRAGELPRPDLAWSPALNHQAWLATDLTRAGRWQHPVVETTPSSQDMVPTATRALAAAHRPAPGQWRQWDHLTADRYAAETELGRRQQDLATRQTERQRRLDYLARGRRDAAVQLADLQRNLNDLDLLLAGLDTALADLDRTRTAALHQFATRLGAIADELDRSLNYLAAARHFRTAGPHKALAAPWPATVPTPAMLLEQETQLNREIAGFLDLFNERVPALINRSCTEVWGPRLATASPALRLRLLDLQRRGAGFAAGIDSTARSLPQDREIAAAADRMDIQSAVVDSLARAQLVLQREIVDDVVERGRGRLAIERERIDYLRGNALYWAAVGAPDDSSGIANRDLARQALDDYLVRYPQGRARAESRYRLADLELLRARDDFRARMAGFLNGQPTAADLQNRDLAPFVDYAPAVTLYESILSEDPDFAHLPAVLFQLGMILGDAGDPRSAEYLETLVTRLPASDYDQEAWLRLGDQHFAVRDYAGCQRYFTAATDGPEPSLRAIALYKLGWAHFEEDQFRDAAVAFGRLLDQSRDAAANAALAANPRTGTDLADEARQYLVHALIRAGGATAFAAHFAQTGPRPYEAEILLAMGHQFAGVSLFGEAIACDRLWLARFGRNDQAVAVSRRLVDTYRSWQRPDDARQTHLELAARFLPGSTWLTAQTDTIRQRQARQFAQAAFRRAAVHAHQRARQEDDPQQWRLAQRYYDQYLNRWPDAEDAPRIHHQAGEASFRLGQNATALAHFSAAANTPAAATDTTGIRQEAAWQMVAVSDAWYRGETAAADTDSLARQLLSIISDYRAQYPGSRHDADLLWRAGQVAYAHQWYDRSAVALAGLARQFPADPRALRAVRMSGDARYQLADFVAAGAAYQQTLDAARLAGADSAAAAIAPLIPQCRYQHAEQVAAADSVGGPVTAAPLFAQVAARWPDFSHADLALYRAGLGYAASARVDRATDAWQTLLTRFPASSYARDSALRIATVREQAGQWQAAAAALAQFSARFSGDPDAAAALLKAADLLAAGGDATGAETLQTTFLQRFPAETESVMAIGEERARRALAAEPSADAEAALSAYLTLAAANPQWAAPEILAEAEFRTAEQARTKYLALELNQPLPAAIKAKQVGLEELLTLYGACATHGVTEFTRASAFRIGEVITHFGAALLASERPTGLQGDDLLAYEEVLEEQSWTFQDRGETAWTELLKQARDTADDPGQWLARTRQELWPRVARRFAHLPAADYPVLAGVRPPATRSPAEN